MKISLRHEKGDSMNMKKNSEDETDTAAFWQAEDIIPEIDDMYLQRLHIRLGEMIWHLYHQLPDSLRPESVSVFIAQEIADLYQSLSREHILENYRDSTGCRCHAEDVYFTWLKQRTLTKLFFPIIAYILQTPATAFHSIEPDIFISKNFPSQQSFLIHILDGKPLRLEIIFDATCYWQIPAAKITAAREYQQQTGYPTLFLYLDLLKNQGALFPLDLLAAEGKQGIRFQKERDRAILLSQEDFIWEFSQIPPIYQETYPFLTAPVQRRKYALSENVAKAGIM